MDGQRSGAGRTGGREIGRRQKWQRKLFMEYFWVLLKENRKPTYSVGFNTFSPSLICLKYIKFSLLSFS